MVKGNRGTKENMVLPFAPYPLQKKKGRKTENRKKHKIRMVEINSNTLVIQGM